jgi:hypothetical protein
MVDTDREHPLGPCFETHGFAVLLSMRSETAML